MSIDWTPFADFQGMVKVAHFDDTGVIVGVATITTDAVDFHLARDPVHTMVLSLEQRNKFDALGPDHPGTMVFYMKQTAPTNPLGPGPLPVLTLRNAMTPYVSSTTIPSDGVTNATISGLPIPCTVSISGPASVDPTVIDDGDIDFNADTPGDYIITVSAPPSFLDWSVTVHAT
jgi:hypothetical protein